jgi:hypothetical protein
MSIPKPNMVLFFDNDDANLLCDHSNNCYCGNVIHIKVNDSFNTNCKEFKQYRTDVNQFISRVTKYDMYNENGVQPGEFTALIPHVLHWHPTQPYVHIFDEKSGITLKQINSFIAMLDDPTNSSSISTIVLDFDRTITMVEGFATANDFKTFASLLENPMCNDMHLIELYMGGKPRLAALKQLLDKIAENNINLVILTNNPNPIMINDFIQTYIRKYDIYSSIYRVISVPHVHGQVVMHPSCSCKLNVLFHLGLINDTYNDKLFPMAMDLESIGFNIHNLARIIDIKKSIAITKMIDRMYKNWLNKRSSKNNKYKNFFKAKNIKNKKKQLKLVSSN